LYQFPVEKELIKSRPTFHYRLANSSIGDPEWSFAKESNHLKKKMPRKGKLDFFLSLFLIFFRKLFSTKQFVEGDKKRDRLETGLLEAAVKNELPILGICRGAQLMNVNFLGTLYQELGDCYGKVPQMWTVRPKKEVLLQKGSKLYELLGHRETASKD
jgi:putative glutamine amidotransferase